MDSVHDALNYPYIRVRDVDWLKSTLLLFPHVARIRPAIGAPPDDPEIEAFGKVIGARGLPLLRSFEADHTNWHEHERLLSDLRKALALDGDRLRRRFGHEATEKEALRIAKDSAAIWHDRFASRWFQLHSDKIFPPLRTLLEDNGLAWQPSHPDGDKYLEMHPTVGEGVMASLAFTIARSRGCQLITEFPKIYNKTVQSSVEDVFSAITSTRPRRLQNPVFTKKSERIVEVIIYQHCDVSRLDAESLALISNERETLFDFQAELQKFATRIPDDMTDEGEIKSHVEDAAHEVLKRWERSRSLLGNINGFLREESQSALKDFAKDGFKGAAQGALFSAPTGQVWLGTAAGAAIGLAFRTIFGSSGKAGGEDPPLRYLSLLRKHGVAITVSPGRTIPVG